MTPSSPSHTLPPWVQHDDLLSAPFAWGGRDPKQGLDCWGLVMEVRRRVGLETPDPFKRVSEEDAEYHRAFSAEVYALFSTQWSRVRTPVQPGDVVELPSYAGQASHAGVVVGHLNHTPYVLHMGKAFGVRCDTLLKLQPHVTAIYRDQVVGE